MSDEIRTKVFKGLIWRLLERVIAQGVSMIISIILARILYPEDYGMIALITVFITLANVFVDGGFGNALVQKTNSDEIDFSSVFSVSFLVSILIYVVIFFCAPFVADFYNNSDVCAILRVLSIQIIVSSFKSTQIAHIQKEMKFNLFFWATSIGTILSGIVGVTLAYCGFGVWALVIQSLGNTVVDTVVLLVVTDWRPRFAIDFSRVRSLFGFGWKVLLWSFATQLFDNIRSLVIGKAYSSEDLAYYSNGRNWPSFIVSNICTSISSVLFPALASKQSNIETVKMMVRRSCSISTFLVSPLLIGMMAIGRELTLLLLTEKWLPMLPFLYICCIYLIFVPIQTAELESVKAVGRSDLLVKMDVFVKIIQIIVLIVSMRIDVYAIAIGSIVTTAFACAIYGIVVRKIIHYTIFEQVRDVAVNMFPAIVMGVTVRGIVQLCAGYCSVFVLVLIGVVSGVCVWLFCSWIMKHESLHYMYSTIVSMFRKKEKV